MIDCLLIGFNDYDFSAYVNEVAAGGQETGAWQDVRLAFVEHRGKPYRALDLLTEFRQEATGDRSEVYHNADFLWPVITYLGTYLSRNGFSFDYANLYQQERERIGELLRSGEVRSVAITTTLYVSPQPILEIVEFVRSQAPDVAIIVGGPYVANLGAESSGEDLDAVLEHLGADIYVIGREGELTLGKVLTALRAPGAADLSAVPNLAYRKGGGFVHTAVEVESNSLPDNLVDYSLFPQSQFNWFVTTRTAKSCPFSCSFCGFPQRSGKYTYLGLPHVEEELDRIAQIPSVSTITFIDDTFNVPKVRFREFCKLLIERKYGFRWNCYYRSDHGDAATIELMREAGCEGVFLGVESGSDAQLERMNKTARRAHYMAAIPAFRAAGISTYASVIIGFPGETDETVAQTVSLLETARPDYFRAQLWYADPVTPIWQKRAEYGIRGRGFNWRHATMNSAQACAHIERIFLEVDDPVWMPQFGFEQWSTFYLQRRGMTADQVRGFVQAFNAVVRDQITHPSDQDRDPLLTAGLRAASLVNLPARAPR